MFSTKTLFWISLPGLLLAGLFVWWFFRADAVPLWLVIAVVGQVLLLIVARAR